jgi:hypothetical protein
MEIDRRTFLAATASCLAARAPAAEPATVFRPEQFGARGDGSTNDTEAFAALSDRVNVAGGGTIVLGAGKTYIVGLQTRGPDRPFSPRPILEFRGLVAPLSIIGSGARLRAADGLRFGSFDPRTALPIHRAMPNVHELDRASPYIGMIVVRGSRAPVAIRDVELDGNLGGLRAGGRWGDSGWQVPGSGLALYDNLDAEWIHNVYSHHHPLDGAIIDGAAQRRGRGRIERLLCRDNGRQGLSIVGGRGYDFEDCDFSRTGRGSIASAPGAGLDIEAEGSKSIRDLSFNRCRFEDNAGPAMGADSGDSADVRFTDCRFVGTTSWAAWPHKPRFTFERCTFAGTVVHPFSSRDPSLATKFLDCRFTDDPRSSPTGRLYVGGAAGNGIVNMDPSDNVEFANCTFDLVRNGVLPWSWRAIYRDCTMKQASHVPAMTKGKFLGRTVIDGPADLYGSMIVGTVVLNGKTLPRGRHGNDFKPW